MESPLTNKRIQRATKEMKQAVFFTRSKSDDLSERPKVLSPTPIRTNDIQLLDKMCGFNSCQGPSNFTEFFNSNEKFPMRKINSLGVLSIELNRDFFEDQEEEHDAADGAHDNSSHYEEFSSRDSVNRTGEIPTRVSNPVIRDPQFQRTNLKNEYFLHSLNRVGAAY